MATAATTAVIEVIEEVVLAIEEVVVMAGSSSK